MLSSCSQANLLLNLLNVPVILTLPIKTSHIYKEKTSKRAHTHLSIKLHGWNLQNKSISLMLLNPANNQSHGAKTLNSLIEVNKNNNLGLTLFSCLRRSDM